MKIAIIGAGISGLTLAGKLAQRGEITIFEKSRGAGGRMATRRAGAFHFDHGAQCFTARTTRFRQFLKPFIVDGIVAKWDGRVINLEPGKPASDRMWFETHLVGAPDMNSLCHRMAQGLDIRTGTEVAPLERQPDDRWDLIDTYGNRLGVFDLVISTAPPAQTVRLFGGHAALAANVLDQKTQPCFAVMLGFDAPWQHDWIAARVRNAPIKWISVNSSKPGRNATHTELVIHSRKAWTLAHLTAELDWVQARLLEAFKDLTGIDPAGATHVATHRWRYALVETTARSGPWYNPAVGLAATSDWASSSRIEEAWLCANQLAGDIAASNNLVDQIREGATQSALQ